MPTLSVNELKNKFKENEKKEQEEFLKNTTESEKEEKKKEPTAEELVGSKRQVWILAKSIELLVAKTNFKLYEFADDLSGDEEFVKNFRLEFGETSALSFMSNPKFQLAGGLASCLVCSYKKGQEEIVKEKEKETKEKEEFENKQYDKT